MRSNEAASIAAALTRFANWLTHSTPGTQYIYHQGFLMEDRQEIISTFGTAADGYTLFDRQLRAVEPFDSLGTAVWQAYCDGYVTLVQRKLAPANYSYIAVRR